VKDPQENTLLRVLVVTDSFPRTSETFIINHVASLLNHGVDVTILARRPPDDAIEHPAVRRYALSERVIHFSMPSSYRQRLQSLLGAIARQEADRLGALNPIKYGLGVVNLQAPFRSAARPKGPFDLIHCHYGHIAASCLDLRRFYRAPLLASFHGYEFTKRFSTRPFLYRRLFADAAAIVANSAYSRQRLLAAGCPPAKIEMLPVFPEGTDDSGDAFLRNQGSEIRVLSVARLDRAKGLQDAICAIGLLRDRGLTVRYTIVGDGPYRDELQGLVTALHLEDVVHFTGWMDGAAVRQQYRANAVFILPSIDIGDGGVETQGLVLQEAKQFGLVALGSELGGIPESLDAGNAGILFEPGSPTDIAEKLLALVEDPKRGADIAVAGRQHYARVYSEGAVVARLLSLYRRVLNTR
jgi:colanic acid/amylovoran biosynthesis glycosyltransferase